MTKAIASVFAYCSHLQLLTFYYGLQVVAERLNFFRYLSHFRSVHRGAYFATLRTTTVRKLMPESWGFMCPVRNPCNIE